MEKSKDQDIFQGQPLEILLNEALMGIMPFDDYYFTSKPDVVLSPVVDPRLEIHGYYQILSRKKVGLVDLGISAKFNPNNVNESSINQLLTEGVNQYCGYHKSFNFGQGPNVDLFFGGGNVTVKFDNQLLLKPNHSHISAKIQLSDISGIIEDYKNMCDILGVKYNELDDQLHIYHSSIGPSKKQVLEGIDYLRKNKLTNSHFSTSKMGLSGIFFGTKGFHYKERKKDDGTIQSEISFGYGSSQFIEGRIIWKEQKLNNVLSLFKEHLGQKTEFNEWQAIYHRRRHYREPVDLRTG